MILLKIRLNSISLTKLSLLINPLRSTNGQTISRLSTRSNLNSISRTNSRFVHSSNVKPKVNLNKIDYGREYLIYELLDKSFLIKIFIAGNAAFLITICFAITLKGIQKPDKPIDRSMFANNILHKCGFFIMNHSTGLSLTSLSIGALIASLCQLYCVSSVKSITLLKGGKKVLVRLFRGNPLSDKSKALEISLKDMCFLNTRTDSNLLIRLQVANHRGFYILHKEGGTFNNFLFDKVVGLFRNVNFIKK